MDKYIFLSGGAYNAAIARMLVALALWLTIRAEGDGSNWAYILEVRESVGWNPKGLAKLFDVFGDGAPSPEFVAGLGGVAKFSVMAMALGLFSRVSTIIAALSTTLLVTLYWSFGPYWSHGSNVQLLAALAFMFARSGDRLSVDHAMRKALNAPDPVLKHDGGYWWPVLFAELATHMFMFGAFYSKITNGDGLWWAWSDNLRNSIGITWGLYRFDPPGVAEWVVAHPFIYKTAGTLQLIAQATTILAIFLARRPVARLILGGSFFFIEILGLARLFRFWHPFWIPLCLLSVDWEWFGAKVKLHATQLYNNLGGFRGAAASTWSFFRRVLLAVRVLAYKGLGPAKTFFIYLFFAAFFGYYAANILLQLGEKHLNYPFSSMAFYSENRAMHPFTEHRYFPIYRGYVELVEADDPEQKPIAVSEMPSDQLEPLRLGFGDEAHFRGAHKSLRARYGGNTRWRTPDGYKVFGELSVIRTYTQLVGVPPYPEPAWPLHVLHSGLLSVEDENGFRGLNPELIWDKERQVHIIRLRPWGFKNPKFEMLYRYDLRKNPRMSDPELLDGHWEGLDFVVENFGLSDGRHLFALIKATDDELGTEEYFAGPENFQTHKIDRD